MAKHFSFGFTAYRIHLDSRWLTVISALSFTTVLNLSLWRYILRHLTVADTATFFFGISIPIVIFTALYLLFNLLLIPYLAKPVLILLLFIALGIVFDIIGVAVTAANPKPFNSMAAHRVKGAKEALNLIRNAEKVASFCNDVVGDICGIVSGSTATVIVVLLQNSFGWRSIVVSTVVTALISGLTIGGKAIGKKVAMKKSKDVIYLAAKVLSVLHLGR